MTTAAHAGARTGVKPRARACARKASRVALAVVGAVGACGGERSDHGAGKALTLATTTTIEDSGLLSVLDSAFRASPPQVRLRVIVAGSGEVLALGRRRDVAVLLTHAPAAESAFVAAGFAAERRPLMYSEFVLVGPPSDPAGVRGERDVAAALRRISSARARFASRGDDSGTHQRELALWREAGIGVEPGRPPADWYAEIGQGMGETLRIASETEAYALTDRPTFLVLQSGLRLELLVDPDPPLWNRYAVLVVEGAANIEAARAFADWLASPAAQELIRSYGRARFGRSLFMPGVPETSPQHTGLQSEPEPESDPEPESEP